MRTTRIYHPVSFNANEVITLSPEASHHITTVLRMQEGQPLTLFNGEQLECSGIIHHSHKKFLQIKILDVYSVCRESPCHIHLAQGIAKGDKMEWIIQKATELGVAEITPIFTQHGAVKQEKSRFEKKWEQWQAIAISACEQSGRTRLPVIHPPCDLNYFLQQKNTTKRYILDPYCTSKFTEIIQSNFEAITLMIGPEGGFHPDELKRANESQFESVSLGPRILRTETAAISALSILQALAGDL